MVKVRNKIINVNYAKQKEGTTYYKLNRDQTKLDTAWEEIEPFLKFVIDSSKSFRKLQITI
jgi:hypothetical protein